MARGEPKWQAKWKEWGIYRFDPESDKEVYSIDTPPRYASGALHLGHAYGYTVIDFAARYKRLKGYNVFFPLCFDVNGTPVEVKVEQVMGIKASEVPRQQFVKMCSEFAEKHIGEMTKQFEMLGESMDPTIYYQTDAEYYRRLTQVSFIRMFKKGFVYKGHFPINFCTRCGTALAEAEVEYEPRKTKLNYIKFRVAGSGREVQIATTRPELLCTCLLVAVHPDDPSKANLVGEELVTPVFDKKVKVVADPKVDPAFGTGTVMICSIGDKGDLEWIMKYNLPLEKGIDESGKMTELAGKYAGMTVADARKAIIEDMKAAGLLVKQEDLDQSVGVCWRCHSPIEFLKVPQWFVRSLQFKDQVLAMIDKITWNPEFMKVRIQNWVNSLAWDWVVSRQRYFATAIPLWECQDCGEVLLAEEDECYVDPTSRPPRKEKCAVCGGEYIGSTDVFDTWMDSSISPLYNTFWERDDKLFKKLYPMSMRPQGLEIIRTWAYYTILREMLLIGEKPWKETMIHGFIMAPDGSPMHASAGNAIDPIPLLEKYGSDAMRYYAATCSLGIDHAFKEQELVRGGRLATKTWNVMRMVGSVCKVKPDDAGDHPTRGRLDPEQVRERGAGVREERGQVQVRPVHGDHRGLPLARVRGQLRRARQAQGLFRERRGREVRALHGRPGPAEDDVRVPAPRRGGRLSAELQAVRASNQHPCVGLARGASCGSHRRTRRARRSREWWLRSGRGRPRRALSLNAEIARIEIVGQEATRLMAGSEEDIKATLKAAELEILEKTSTLKETVSRVKPVHAKLGPAFKKDAKEIAERLAGAASADPSWPAWTRGSSSTMGDGRTIELSPEFYEVERNLSIGAGRARVRSAVAGLSVLVYQ